MRTATQLPTVLLSGVRLAFLSRIRKVAFEVPNFKCSKSQKLKKTRIILAKRYSGGQGGRAGNLKIINSDSKCKTRLIPELAAFESFKSRAPSEKPHGCQLTRTHGHNDIISKRSIVHTVTDLYGDLWLQKYLFCWMIASITSITYLTALQANFFAALHVRPLTEGRYTDYWHMPGWTDSEPAIEMQLVIVLSLAHRAVKVAHSDSTI